MRDVLRILTDFSLQSTASLLPDDVCADEMLAEYNNVLNNLSSVIDLNQEHINSKWNKTYGEGGTKWRGALNDGRKRGGVPYYCPAGWARFSLNVCPDEEFERRFSDWAYVYHGTNSKFIGPILSSGLRASKGLCFCGPTDQAVYMSPSIEYSGHPRYGAIEYNPETRKYMQMVLQCRVNPNAVWKKERETMRCKAYGLTCDPNIPNEEMEWLFRPTHYDDVTGCYFIKDTIICTGIMLRLTDKHPCDLDYWWTDPAYLKSWDLECPIVDPMQKIDQKWIRMVATEQTEFKIDGSCMDETFKLNSFSKQLGWSVLSPRPFAKGGMRFAYHLHTAVGDFALKEYNKETLKHVLEGLRIDEDKAIRKEVATYLVAQQFAVGFNAALPEAYKDKSNFVRFLDPYVFKLKDKEGRTRVMFGERYVEGQFIKWNSNAGYVNSDEIAKEGLMDQMAEVFAHHTYHASKGRLMVVDIQGWNSGAKTAERSILFTDPQIHTQSFQRGANRNDMLYDRFSLGNLGRTGMVRFFQTHTCSSDCAMMGIKRSAVLREDTVPVPVDRGSVLQRAAQHGEVLEKRLQSLRARPRKLPCGQRLGERA